MIKGRDWRPFEEAREYVRGLGLRSKSEWAEYCKSGQKPDDIPANPPKTNTYTGKWLGWQDWLGYRRVRQSEKKVRRPFEAAREFVRGLGLKSHREWQDYCKSGKKPDDIPVAPIKLMAPNLRGTATGWGLAA